MSVVLGPLIVAVTVLAMTAVGTDMTMADVRRVAARRVTVMVATVAQWVLLPAVAVALVVVLRPAEPVALALLLAAACPGGALSNAYVFLAGADTALSVVLTAVSTVMSAVTLPVLLVAGHAAAGMPRETVAGLWGQAFVPLLGAVLLPVSAGMFFRHRWPAVVGRHGAALRRVAGLGVVLVIVLIVADQGAPLGRHAAVTLGAGLLAGIAAGAAGFGIGAALGLPPAGRFAVGIESVTRNMALFSMVGLTVLRRPELLAIGVVLFLTQAALSLGSAALWRRRFGADRQEPPAGDSRAA